MTTDAMSGWKGKMMSSGPKRHVVWAPFFCFFLFFGLLFFLLSHRYSCHHHDHGHHVRTEGKDDEQWAPTTCFFNLFFFVLLTTTAPNDADMLFRLFRRFVTTSAGCPPPATPLIGPDKAHKGPSSQRRPMQAHEEGKRPICMVFFLMYFFFFFFFFFFFYNCTQPP